MTGEQKPGGLSTTPDLAGLCERLRLDMATNPDWAPVARATIIECNTQRYQAAAAIERLVAENERMREALVQADLTIRSLHGTDQSHVEFIRTALQGASDDR